MKLIEYLENCKVGSIITNKRLLATLKRKGLIYAYSYWGYLEACSIYSKDGSKSYLHLFGLGDAPKYDIVVNNTTYSEYIHNRSTIEYKGYEFSYKYESGCFSPYLQLVNKK